MAEAESAGVLPAEVPALAEDDLGPGVVAVRVVAEVHVAEALAPVVPPPRERPGLLADVVLGVAVPGAQREELHQLAGVVLVRVPPRVLVAVEPEEHRRVVREREDQRLERAQRVRPHRLVLDEHPLLRADALVRGREPVVPDQRHPLDEGLVRADHPVEPPQVVVAPGVARGERGSVVVCRRPSAQADARRIDEIVDRALQALAGDAGSLARARPEPRTPEKALGFLPSEGTSVHGHAACHLLMIETRGPFRDPFSCTATVIRGRRRARSVRLRRTE